MNYLDIIVPFTGSLFSFLFLKYALYNLSSKSHVSKSDRYSLFIYTCISLVHGLICTLTNMYVFFTLMIGIFDLNYYNMVKSFSMAYFVLDTFNMIKVNNIGVIIHHIVAIICLLLTIKFYSQEYVIYETMLMIIGEITNPPQNTFFATKSWYGKEREKEFNTNYYNFFRNYIIMFASVRFLIAPILFFKYIHAIDNTIHAGIIAICFVIIILGSIKWSHGQYNVLKKMKENSQLNSKLNSKLDNQPKEIKKE